VTDQPASLLATRRGKLLLGGRARDLLGGRARDLLGRRRAPAPAAAYDRWFDTRWGRYAFTIELARVAQPGAVPGPYRGEGSVMTPAGRAAAPPGRSGTGNTDMRRA
jgi:hypothetical protein